MVNFKSFVQELCQKANKTNELLDSGDPSVEINENKIEEILPDEFLAEIPFGGNLIQSLSQFPEQKLRTHVLYVVTGANSIIFKTDDDLVTNVPEAKQIFHSLQAFSDPHIDHRLLRKIFMCASLFHDIGKGLALDRHPFEGFHLIRDLGSVLTTSAGQTEKEIFDLWLTGSSSPQDIYYRNFFLKLIKYHDIWGNITTGEASILMFSSTLDLAETSCENYQLFLGYLMLLNLADQFGTPSIYNAQGSKVPTQVPSETVSYLCVNWQKLKEYLDTADDTEKIKSELMHHSQRQGIVIDRIYTLLQASNIRDIAKEQVEEISKDICGMEFANFCRCFGVVRLSYALKFFRAISDSSESSEIKAQTIIKILNRIIQTYHSLILTNQTQGRETGIEMSRLTRVPAVSNAIVKSLLKSDSALSWLDDEISAFPC